MRVIRLVCEHCGAQLDMDLDKGFAVCPYCNSQIVIDQVDERVQITNRIVDEARLKEAEVRIKELEYLREKELREEEMRRKKKNTRLLILVAGLFFLYMVYNVFRNHFPAAVLVAVIAWLCLRSEDRSVERRNANVGWSPKSRLAALLLCIMLGVIGAHHFYAGKIGMGILYLFTGGLFGIGWFVDVIRIACGTYRDNDGLYIKNWE